MRCLLFALILGMMICSLGSVALCELTGPDAAAPPAPAAPAAAPDAVTAPAVTPPSTAPVEDAYIFKGDDPTAEGILLGGWGSGGAAKSQEQKLEGPFSIKLTTQGLYAGGKIEFSQPQTLLSGDNGASRYVQFAFLFKETQIVNPAASTEVTWTDVEPYQKPRVSRMRFVFVSDTGTSVEVVEPTGAIDPDDSWMRVAVPVTRLKTKDDVKEFRLKRLLIFTDLPCGGMTTSGVDSSLYLGSIKLMTDTSPIKVDPLDPRTVAIMDPQYFAVTANGGVSALKYSWDFDDSNGIQADSTDRIARTVYTKGGIYTVTLTVSDADGIKAPVTVSTTIEVTD